jgi:hypothetical protein
MFAALSPVRRCIPKNIVGSNFFCNITRSPLTEEKDINAKFREIMARKPTNAAKLDVVLTEAAPHLTSFNIVFLFSQAQKCKVNFSSKMLFRLAHLLQTRNDVLTPTDASICMYAMRDYIRDSQAHTVIGVVGNKMEMNVGQYSSEMIANSMNGLRNMSSTNPSVAKFLRVMHNKIVESSVDMTPSHISGALYGMKSMTVASNPKQCAVLPMLEVLNEKILRCSGEWQAWEVGNAMLGLQMMNSEPAVIRKIVNSLSLLLKQSSHSLDARTICNILVGMRNMSAEHAEVRHFVQRVAEKIDTSLTSDAFDSIAVGNSINGLGRMQCKHPQVKNLVKKLSAKVAQCQEPIEHRHLAMALNGMRNMSSSSEEVRELIGVMTHKLSAAKEGMKMNDLAKMFTCLGKCSTEHTEVRQLLFAIDNVVEHANFSELHTGHIVAMINSLRSIGSSSSEARALIAKLAVLSKASAGLPYTADEVTRVIQGMALMDTNDNEVKELYASLVLKSRSLSSAQEVKSLREELMRTFGDKIAVTSIEQGADISSQIEELDNLITALDLNRKKDDDDYLAAAADLFNNTSLNRK